ncbi:MAG: right-handed parallel beta-helix repeat-containing protein, partial [Planctomycetota bacterium]
MVNRTNIVTRLAFSAFFTVLGGAATVAGKVIYVDGVAGGTNDGSSWSDAFTDLQDALAAAQEDDEIRVAQGIYTPTQNPLDREATFDLKDGVSIIGGYAGLAGTYPDSRHTKAYATILSGDIDHNDDIADPNNKERNSRHVITCTGEGNAAVLEGIVITGGYAWPSRGHDSGAASGGGLYCLRGSSPRLIDCVFKDNYAGAGGAVDVRSGSYPVFTRCIWEDNYVGSGAVYVSSGSHPVFTGCIWQDNEAEGSGGAICAQRSSYLISLKHCVFRRNSAGGRGGAIFTDIMGEVQIVNCLFVANTAGDSGGAISCLDHNDGTGRSLFNLVNCTFYGNTSPTFDNPPTNSLKQPDGSRVYWSDSVITNCIFYNEPSDMAVAFEFGRSEPLIITSIYERWPEPGQRRIVPPMPDLLFVDPYGADGILGTEDDDFRLCPISPGVDSGDPNYVPGPNEIDLGSNPRIVSGRIDMGAYEFQGQIYVDDDAPADP